MLIQFTVGNFLSFRENVTLSMVKTAMHDLPENVIKVEDDFELLKSVVVYGANASGKSNLILALGFMRFFTINSFRAYQPEEEIGRWSFRLNETSENQPSFFEIVFMVDSITYRYGFELDKKKVNKEWLYFTQKNEEKQLFVREGLRFIISEKDFSEGINKETDTRENCLFLSLVSQLNGPISSKIINWFTKLHSRTATKIESVFSQVEKDTNLKEDVMRFVSIADNGVIDFISQDILPDQSGDTLPQAKRKVEIKKLMYFIHNIFNEKKEISGKVKFSVHTESEGTKKMFALSVPVINALKNGEILVIDELENHLHPKLFEHIIKLFNSYSNKNNAQLIFATHNLTCMNNKCFRRDQIWFTEKNNLGESSLFSLADYKLDEKKIRNDASYSKDYMLGKYGAVPFINEINLAFTDKENGQSV
ncbi:MAG: ATP-binding protein [Candidatus Saganbacteria bacterium]|nr:ATP-binding protein [Candidatus Saganbacteria bacterium]